MTLFKDQKWGMLDDLRPDENAPVYSAAGTSPDQAIKIADEAGYTPDITKSLEKLNGWVLGSLRLPFHKRMMTKALKDGVQAEWVYYVYIPEIEPRGRPQNPEDPKIFDYLEVYAAANVVAPGSDSKSPKRIPNDTEVGVEFKDLESLTDPVIVEIVGESPFEGAARKAGGPGGSSRNAYNGSDCQYTGPTNTGTNCSEAGVKQGPISKVEPRFSYNELDLIRQGGAFDDLMTYIASKEGGYNSVNRGDGGDSIGKTIELLGKNLTSMTISEVLSYMKAFKGSDDVVVPAGSRAHLVAKSPRQLSGQVSGPGIMAVGKYQWVPSTYRETLAALGINVNSNKQFNSTTQETMALQLLLMQRPKLGSYLLGLHNNECEAGQQVAREWASFPLQYAEAGNQRGQSRYAGTANNRSGHPPEEVIEKLRAARHSFAQWDRSKALLADKGYTAEPGTPGSEPAPSPSCDQASNASGPSAPTAREGSAPRVSGGSRILLIGDSQMASTPLSQEIKRDLEKQGAQEVKILAKPTRGLFVKAGFWSIEDSGGLVQTTLKNFKPNLVIVGLGGNDSYTMWHDNKREIYEARVRKWVNVIQGASSQVIWLGPSHSSKIEPSGTPYDQFRQKIREHQQGVLGSLSVPWYNMKNLTEDLEKSDGTHFTRSSYRQWAQRLLDGPLSGVRSSLSV